MKISYIVLAGLAAGVLAFFVSCAGAPKFTEIKGKDWKLVEVRISSSNPPALVPNTIVFDRRKLSDEGLDDIFVLNFNDAEASGKAAPADFSAPYELALPQALTFRDIAIVNDEKSIAPENLKEIDYFGYLKKVSRWEYTNGRLELYSSASDGNEVVLVFTAG
jgi:heat shock protein HslJ